MVHRTRREVPVDFRREIVRGHFRSPSLEVVADELVIVLWPGLKKLRSSFTSNACLDQFGHSYFVNLFPLVGSDFKVFSPVKRIIQSQCS